MNKWGKIRKKGRTIYILKCWISTGFGSLLGLLIGNLYINNALRIVDLALAFGCLIGGMIGGTIGGTIRWNINEEKYRKLLD